jgi:EmrB/QacA subfamily drug resistance transporter
MIESVSSAEGSAHHAAAQYSHRRRTLALIAVALAFVIDLLDTTIVNVAVPSIGTTLHAPKAALEWIVAGYATAFAVLLIVGGRLGDSQGYRRMFLIGITAFTATSVACGLAPDTLSLQIGRLLQGAGAALMVPQVMALVQVMYPPEERYKVYTVFGFLGGFSAALGPIVGGLLIDADWLGLGWRLTFLINLPLGLASLVAGAVLLPPGRGVHPVAVDVRGAVLSVLVLFALLTPLIEGPARGWPPALIALLLGAAPLGWIAWRHLVKRQARQGDALVDPALFRLRKVALGLLCTLCVNPIMPGYLLVMTFVLQTGTGLSAAQMAYACAPIAFGAMTGITLLGPRLNRRIGVRTLLAGIAVSAASLVVCALALRGGLSWPLLVAAQFGMGVGLGLCGPQLSFATLRDVPVSSAGVAAGLLTTVQQVAAAFGVALAGLVFFHGLDATATEGYRRAYLHVLPLLLGLLGAGALGALRLVRAMDAYPPGR